MLASRRDRLGFVVKPKGPPTLLSDATARLFELAAAGETRAARAEVDAALACPWWSLRVKAIEVIAEWGGPRNNARLLGRVTQPMADRSKGARWQAAERNAAWRALIAHDALDKDSKKLRLKIQLCP